jgi:undecaprenyl-diphosphatase
MDPIYHMTYLQAVVIGLIQGVTELFPISSLGHTVLIPSWIGGSWGTLVRQESRAESPYLAFVVGLHLATAIVLLGVYAKTWVRVIRGFFTSVTRREVRSADQKLAWLIVVATIPVGLAGLALEHPFRVLFAKPLAAAIFLTINGAILLGGEILRRRTQRPPAVSPEPAVSPQPAVSPRQEALVGAPGAGGAPARAPPPPRAG